MSLGGSAYLNFMGNEYGHPEVPCLLAFNTYYSMTEALVQSVEWSSKVPRFCFGICNIVNKVRMLPRIFNVGCCNSGEPDRLV